MTGLLSSVKARFDDLDRGSKRRERARLPIATSAWASVMIGTAVATWDSDGHLRATIVERFAWSTDQVLAGQPWRVVTATALTRDAFMLGSLLLTTGTYLWVLERITTTGVALGVWALGGVTGFAGTTAVLWAASALGSPAATNALSAWDFGPSAGTAAVAAAIVVLLRHRAVTVASVLVLVALSARRHEVADIEHIVSFAVTLAVGPTLVRHLRSGAHSASAPPSKAHPQ